MFDYRGLRGVTNTETPHLGGNVLQGDPHTYSPSVWDYLINRFAVNSVMDLGAGLGHSSDYFHKAGMKVISVEGMAENCRKALYPTIQVDLTKNAVCCSVDLVHCQEVVEHIEEKYIDNLMESLFCGRIIVISHALPGQGGYYHVNEQPREYWVDQFAKRGGQLLEEDSKRVRTLAAKDDARFLAQTGLVFYNNRFS